MYPLVEINLNLATLDQYRHFVCMIHQHNYYEFL